MNNLKPWRKAAIPIAVIIAAAMLPFVTANAYQAYILNILGLYMLLNFGLNISLGYCGQINFAMAALWGVGAYTSTLLTVDLGVNVWLALPVSGLVAAGLGALVGTPSLKVRSHYLAIVTIGLASIINLVLVNERNITRGAIGIPNIPSPSIFGLELDTDRRYFYLILVCVVLGYLFARFIVNNRIGRNFVAIRDDHVAAQAMGINIAYYQILAFAISGFYAGIAGSLYAHKLHYVSPDIFGFGSMMLVLTMTLVGGTGNLNGSIIGSLLILLQEYLRQLKDFQLIVYGIVVVLVVIFFPGGVVGLADRLTSWRPMRITKKTRVAS
jgi:branched-chain amino acid transport system permease protein